MEFAGIRRLRIYRRNICRSDKPLNLERVNQRPTITNTIEATSRQSPSTMRHWSSMHWPSLMVFKLARSFLFARSLARFCAKMHSRRYSNTLLFYLHRSPFPSTLQPACLFLWAWLICVRKGNKKKRVVEVEFLQLLLARVKVVVVGKLTHWKIYWWTCFPLQWLHLAVQ